MSISDTIKKYVDNFRAYIEAEVDLLKYQAVKRLGGLLGMLFTAIFIMLLFHLTMAFFGVWLGVWIGTEFSNYSIGFGASFGFFVLWLLLCIVFKRSLLVRPFSKIIVATILAEEEKREILTKDEVEKS